MTDFNPVFLSVDNVLFLHRNVLEKEDGLAGVRDIGLLEAAVSMPQQKFADQFLHEDLPAMAAAYLFHLAKNHAFLDGNKRTAALTALSFLAKNDCPNLPAPKDLETATLAVATGEWSKDYFVVWMREQTTIS